MKKYHFFGISIAFFAAFLYACSAQQPIEEPVAKIEDTQQVKAEDTAKTTPVEPVEVQKTALTLAEKYLVAGKNPGGVAYSGTLQVLKDGEKYTFTMKQKARTIVGNGTLDGNKLTIFWGKNRRFDYEVKEDGKVVSTWAKGEEIYTPER